MARIQKIESDSSFASSNILSSTILLYKTVENGTLKQKAKLPGGTVVEVPFATEQDSPYTKSQIDQFLASISDSISRLQHTFQNYYTAVQINDIVSDLSDSIQNIKNRFANYYDKTQIDQKLLQLSNSFSLSNYYTKTEVDSLISKLSNSIEAVKDTLGGYYTKVQLDPILSAISDSLEVINNKLQDYYTSTQIDSLIQSISNSLSSIRQEFQNYYTKVQTYTKQEVNALVAGLSNSFSFSDYYKKAEIDQKLAAKYNTSDAAVVESSVTELSRKAIKTVQFSSVNNNRYTVNNNVVVIGIFDNTGTYYPVEKFSVQYSDSNTYINLLPYLAYSGMSSFTGTWTILMSEL